jgi:hypothetical protein
MRKVRGDDFLFLKACIMGRKMGRHLQRKVFYTSQQAPFRIERDMLRLLALCTQAMSRACQTLILRNSSQQQYCLLVLDMALGDFTSLGDSYSFQSLDDQSFRS